MLADDSRNRGMYDACRLDCERARSARLEREKDEAMVARDQVVEASRIYAEHAGALVDAALSRATAAEEQVNALMVAEVRPDGTVDVRPFAEETERTIANLRAKLAAAEELARGLGEALEDCYAQAPEWYRRKHGDYVEEQLAAWRKP